MKKETVNIYLLSLFLLLEIQSVFLKKKDGNKSTIAIQSILKFEKGSQTGNN